MSARRTFHTLLATVGFHHSKTVGSIFSTSEKHMRGTTLRTQRKNGKGRTQPQPCSSVLLTLPLVSSVTNCCADSLQSSCFTWSPVGTCANGQHKPMKPDIGGKHDQLPQKWPKSCFQSYFSGYCNFYNHYLHYPFGV